MSSREFLRYVIYAGLFLIPFIAFVVSTSLFFPFITGKAFVFRVLVEVLFGCFLLLAFQDRTYWPRKNMLLIAFGIFVAVIGVANLFGIDPYHSFWSNLERMEGYITMLHLFLYFVVLSGVMVKEALWVRLLNTTLGASALMALYSLLQKTGAIAQSKEGNRIEGTLGNPTYLAAFMVFHVFLSLFLMVRFWQNKTLRYIYMGIGLLDVFVLLYTGTRGAMLGVIGGLGLVCAYFVFSLRHNTRIRRAALGIAFLGTLLFSGLILFKDSAFVQSSLPLQRLTSISLTEATAESRLMVWNMAWQGFQERPILGWGQENFKYVFSEYYNPNMYNHEPWFDHAHNIFFDWLVAGGILGVVSYFALYVVSGIILYRSTLSPLEKVILGSLLIAYIIQNFFVFDNITSYILFVMTLSFIGYYGQASLPLKPRPLQIPELGKHAIVLGTLTLMGLTLYVWNLKPASAAYNLLQAFRYPPASDEQVEVLDAVLEGGTFVRYEAREQMSDFARRAVFNGIITSENSFFTRAKEEMEKQVAENPHDPRAYIFTAHLLTETGAYEEARPYWLKALELSPKKQNIIFGLMRNSRAEGRYDEVLMLAKEAYMLAPEFHEAAVTYAHAVATLTGDTAQAIHVLDTIYAKHGLNNITIINAYAQIGAYERVVDLWKERIRQVPTDMQAYVSLAATYVQLGNREEAIKALEDAMVVDPAFEAQAQDYINQIRAGTL